MIAPTRQADLSIPSRVRRRHLDDPHYPRGFRTMPPLSERVAPHACTCASSPARCPWHLGRMTLPPSSRDEHPIPRILGISSGAWLLFVGLHRCTWSMADQGKTCAPGRRRCSRYVGGRNARTRPLDELGRPIVGVRFEKGTCDEGSVTAYLHELRCARMPDGRPLLVTKRHPNAPMTCWLHPDVLHDPEPVYQVRMRWDLGTTVPGQPDPTTPNGASARSAESLTSPSSETPSRLGACTRTLHPDVETSEQSPTRAQLLCEAEREPWWWSWVEQIGSREAARRDLSSVLRTLMREKLGAGDVRRVYELLTHSHTRGHKPPKRYAAWFLAAARKGWHVQEQDGEKIASNIAEAEARERARILQNIERATMRVDEEARALELAEQPVTVERELTEEERLAAVEELRLVACRKPATPAQAPAAIA